MLVQKGKILFIIIIYVDNGDKNALTFDYRASYKRQNKKRRTMDPNSEWKERLRRQEQNWEDQIGPITDAFLEWKHAQDPDGDKGTAEGDPSPGIRTINGISCISMFGMLISLSSFLHRH